MPLLFRSLLAVAVTAAVAASVSAAQNAPADGNHHLLAARQNKRAPAASNPAPTYPAVVASPVASLATIGTATTVEATMALPTTYAPGSTAPVRGAPVLPNAALLAPADYPDLDHQPFTNSTEVAQWVSEINWDGIPNIPVTGLNGCQNTTLNAANIAAAGADQNCWWTCGGCTRATDISYCPTPETWGLSYDDGPSPYTPRLLNFLNAEGIKGTFFIVGSRAISRPEMVQYEYMSGHQLSVHTWAHPALTTMTNEQIVAELGWTKKIIKDITGVTPNTMRPPYGDIDDRVRYISLQMGLTPIIWTAADGNTFDTRDYQIGGGETDAPTVYNNFVTYLNSATSTLRTGFIVLEHDLYQQSVELAVNYVLPLVVNTRRLTLQPIITCLGSSLEEAYIETSSNMTAVTQTSATVIGATGVGFVPGVGVGVGGQTSASTSTTTTTATSPTSTATQISAVTSTSTSSTSSASVTKTGAGAIHRVGKAAVALAGVGAAVGLLA